MTIFVRLEPGDCGSIVCKVNSETDELTAIGVLIGELKHHPEDTNMYKAAILSLNIHKIEKEEALQISQIELLRSPDDI